MGMPLSVAVVICTIGQHGYDRFKVTIEKLLRQSYKIDQIIVVVSGDEILADRIRGDYVSRKNVSVVSSKEVLNISQARNAGTKTAKTDIVAFTDDDTIADAKWVESLVEIYRVTGAPAVGGKILSIWQDSRKPAFLPEELYWLVGVTDASFYDDQVMEVRNTFGPNMSYRRTVFDSVGYFDERLGFARNGNAPLYIGGEEQEFCLRMRSKLGRGIIYNPNAVVHHRVPKEKLYLPLLLKRAFYFGYSKAYVNGITHVTGSFDREMWYLKNVFSRYLPGHLEKSIMGNSRFAELQKLCVLTVSVIAIGLGFLCKAVKPD